MIHGDGEQKPRFTFVDDAVRANLLPPPAPRQANRAPRTTWPPGER